MEIGHNVLHGQWDWMHDPAIHSSTWEWDAASTAASWKRAHNYQHHTYTNVLGRDRDLGYSAMRVEPEQPWHPVYLLQPVYFFLMAAVFEWGIALYDMELDAVKRGEKTRAKAQREVVALLRKAGRQLLKDYVLFPVLAGRRGSAGRSLGNVVANLVRNVWVHTIVFCGHIPEGAETFTEERVPRRDARRLVPPPAARLVQPRGQPALPPAHRQPLLPDRAPPLPGPAEQPLREDRARRARCASATACRTTAADSGASTDRSTDRYCAWHCPAGERRTALPHRQPRLPGV